MLTGVFDNLLVPLTMMDLFLTPFLLIALVGLALFDLRHFRLPDAITLPLIFVGLALAFWREQALPVDAIVGAGIGYAAFAVLGWAFHRYRNVEGLGLGDAKLLAAAGAWMGWGALPLIVLCAAVGAILFTLVLRNQSDPRIAFGPWLGAAFAGVWLARLLV